MMPNEQQLVDQMVALKPWHQIIEVTEDISTATPFTNEGRLVAQDNDGVHLIPLRKPFMTLMRTLYRDGLAGKRLLDCACNAGAYCFFAKELGVDEAVGFDVRRHWIEQAEFLRQNRTYGPVDGISFFEQDLYDVPNKKLEPFDITIFKGIYYHLPDPILGLKIAAELTTEILWMNSTFEPREDVNALISKREGIDEVMSGVHHLSFYPTNPLVVAHQLEWLGFRDIRLLFARRNPRVDYLGRLSIIASRSRGPLEPIHTISKGIHSSDLKGREKVLFFEPKDIEMIRAVEKPPRLDIDDIGEASACQHS